MTDNKIHITNENLDCAIVTLFVHNLCNYSCSYCSDAHRDGSNRWQADVTPYTKLLEQVRKRNKYTYVEVLGGEPTLWPKFQEFIRAISDNNTYVSFATNASRTLRYWEEFPAGPYLVCMSWHHEECDDDHFVKVAEILQHKVSVSVQLMVLPENFERAKRLHDRLKKLKIDIMPKLVRLTIGKGVYFSYTDEQRNWITTSNISNFDHNALQWQFPVHLRFNGERIRFVNVLDAGFHDFNGWECSAGIRRLYVNVDGSIYRCSNRIGGKLGNIFEEYELPEDTITCTTNSCHCKLDAVVEKWSPIITTGLYTQNKFTKDIFIAK